MVLTSRYSPSCPRPVERYICCQLSRQLMQSPDSYQRCAVDNKKEDQTRELLLETEDDTEDFAIVRNLMQLVGSDNTFVASKRPSHDSQNRPSSGNSMKLCRRTSGLRVGWASALPSKPAHSPKAVPTPSIPRVRRRSLQTHTPSANLHEVLADVHVQRVLQTVETWDEWDAFRLAEATGNRPLSVLTLWCLRRANLIEKLDLCENQLEGFLNDCESRYTDNRYHNRTHAADVVKSVHAMLTLGGVGDILSDLDQLALYIAAAGHDMEHGGLNNDFLIKTQDPMAICYNDVSPLENHHCAAVFKLIKVPSNNFLASMPADTFKTLRKTVIECILATDMAKHFQTVSMWDECDRLFKEVLTAHYSGDWDSLDDESVPRAAVVTLLQMVMKCADTGHLAQSLPVHVKWVKCLEEEFFLQGDRERMLGMPTSPLMDRSKGDSISRSQVSFFKVVAMPMFAKFTGVFPGMQPMLKCVESNYTHWCDEELARSTSPRVSHVV